MKKYITTGLSYFVQLLIMLALATPLLGYPTDTYYNIGLLLVWIVILIAGTTGSLLTLFAYGVSVGEFSATELNLEKNRKLFEKQVSKISHLQMWVSFVLLVLPVGVLLAATGSVVTAVIYIAMLLGLRLSGYWYKTVLRGMLDSTATDDAQD
jgi:hypothetical protein